MALAAGVADSQAALTASQASKLQKQVDEVVREGADGTRQVAPNKVAWASKGVTLTLPVPGQARTAALRDCPRGYACVWAHANYQGPRAAFYNYRD